MNPSVVIRGTGKYTLESAGIVLIIYDENTQKVIDGAAFWNPVDGQSNIGCHNKA